MHSVSHITLLKNYVGDPAFIVPNESMTVKGSISYKHVPVEILDRPVIKLRNNEVLSVKVLWRSQYAEGSTYEAAAFVKAKYPHLFPLYSSPP